MGKSPEWPNISLSNLETRAGFSTIAQQIAKRGQVQSQDPGSLDGALGIPPPDPSQS
ncbi:MAG: hypothetical protein P8P56_12365 [Yoonia sp.]|nr:hypothetical protein [Yoonia sp.]MDG1863813.1 hypothetical protein [Yoonia sp.]